MAKGEKNYKRYMAWFTILADMVRQTDYDWSIKETN